MEVSIPLIKSGTHIRVHEEKMMMCSNNCEDTTSKMHDDKSMICASNCEDSAFHMEVSPPKGDDGEFSNPGCGSDVDLKENDVEVLDTSRDFVLSLKENDVGVSNLDGGGVVGLKGNDVGVSNSDIDGVVGLKGNDEAVSNLGCLKENDEVVSNSGCLKGNDGAVSNSGCLNGNVEVVSSLDHDSVVASKENNEEILDSNCDGDVGFKANHDIVSNLGHDGVVSNYSHDGIVGRKGSNNRDIEVDIVHNGDVEEERVAEMDPQDGTESSSSFGCTDDSGDGSSELSSDSEVESHFQNDNISFMRSKGFSDLVTTRKKKVTSHWRKFIRPLTWRCKWVELQLRELHSQACKYERELSECEKIKQSQLPKCAIDHVGLKSTPFKSQYHRSVNLMKRKKRRRVEETVDFASYTSSHNLFSYYASRRLITGSMYMDDDPGNTDVGPTENSPFANNELGINSDWASFEFNGCDAFESILRKIEDTQLHVLQLRARLDKVVKENAVKFVSSSTAPGEQYAKSTDPNSVLARVNPGKTLPGSSVLTPPKAMSEKVMMPENVGHGSVKAGGISNGVKSTEPAQSGGKLEKMELQSQTHSQPLQEQLHKPEEVNGRTRAASELVTDVKDPNGKRAMNVEQAAKLCMGSKMITKNRKRGRRKAVSGRWSKKLCG